MYVFSLLFSAIKRFTLLNKLVASLGYVFVSIICSMKVVALVSCLWCSSGCPLQYSNHLVEEERNV